MKLLRKLSSISVFEKTIILALLGTSVFNTIYNPKSILILLSLSIVLIVYTHLKKLHLTNNKKIISLILLYIGFSTLSFYLGQTKNIGLYELSLDFIGWIFFLIIILTNTRLHYLFTTLITLNFVQSLIGLSQVLFRDETRIAGSFFSFGVKANYYPNAYALFLIFTFPFLTSIQNKYLRNTSLILSLLATFFSFSRGGLLVVIVQILILSLYYLWTHHRQKTYDLLITSIISFLLFFTWTHLQPQTVDLPLTEKYTFQGTEALTSVGERAQFFQGSLSLISKKPFLGYGPDSFSYIYPSVQPILLANAPHTHNIFLKIGLERGLITLFFFIILLGSLFQKIKLSQLKENNHLFLIITAITGGLLHNQIDYNFNFALNSFIFIILLSQAYLYINSNSKNKLLLSKLKQGIIVFLILIIPITWSVRESKYQLAKSNIENNPQQSQKLLTNLNYKLSNHTLYSLTKDSNYLKTQININSLDANAYNLLGDYKTAIQLDPKNNLEYYTNYYSSNSNLIQTDQLQILDLLLQYRHLAALNIHYTAKTNNIKEAIKLANISFNNTQEPQFQQISKDLQSIQKIFSQKQ